MKKFGAFIWLVEKKWGSLGEVMTFLEMKIFPNLSAILRFVTEVQLTSHAPFWKIMTMYLRIMNYVMGATR